MIKGKKEWVFIKIEEAVPITVISIATVATASISISCVVVVASGTGDFEAGRSGVLEGFKAGPWE